ncbi:MAG: hypothetical protein MUF16_21160, partial [Burkholderiaceae bacterium]|nr:hypothetical protein [Burkholderiaceae bacterium]
MLLLVARNLLFAPDCFLYSKLGLAADRAAHRHRLREQALGGAKVPRIECAHDVCLQPQAVEFALLPAEVCLLLLPCRIGERGLRAPRPGATTALGQPALGRVQVAGIESRCEVGFDRGAVDAGASGRVRCRTIGTPACRPVVRSIPHRNAAGETG